MAMKQVDALIIESHCEEARRLSRGDVAILSLGSPRSPFSLAMTNQYYLHSSYLDGLSMTNAYFQIQIRGPL